VGDSILWRETARGAMTAAPPGTMAASRSRSILRRCGALVLAAMFSCPACGAVGSDPVLLQRFEDLRTRDDLDGMVKRRFVRALVVYSKTSTSSTAVAAAGWSPRACKPSWRISIDR